MRGTRLPSFQEANILSVVLWTEHDGTILYRFSAAKALSVLRAKMDALAEPNGPQSLFGAYESTQLGEVKPEVEGETPIADVAKPHPTVSRGLAREGCGDGVGLSEAIQRGARHFFTPSWTRRTSI